MKRKYVREVLIPLAVFALIVFIAIRLFISFVIMPLRDVHDHGHGIPPYAPCPRIQIQVDGKQYDFSYERLSYAERPDCEFSGTIETIIPDLTRSPTQDNEANYLIEARGAGYVICDGYLAILIHDTWYRCDLSEEYQ